MPKKTQNKASELVKPGKNSSQKVKYAYDIVDSVNKMKNTGKSSRTKKKENSYWYNEIIQHSEILFSLLKEKVDMNEAKKKAININDVAYLISKFCDNYLQKNRGFRWSPKGRERVNQVRRLNNAIVQLFIGEFYSDFPESYFGGKTTYGQAFGMSSYLSTNTTEASSNVSSQAQSESATGSENSNLLDVNHFNKELPTEEDLKTYVNNCLGTDFYITLIERYGILKELKVEKDKAKDNREWLIVACAAVGNIGTQVVELIWNSYRYEINRQGGELLPELKDYLKLK